MNTQMNLSIEKGISIPPKVAGRPKGSGKYGQILRQMKIGDSVHVPNEGARATMFRAAHVLGIKITSRKEVDGFRIWRKK
jgi:hypothetical protein